MITSEFQFNGERATGKKWGRIYLRPERISGAENHAARQRGGGFGVEKGLFNRKPQQNGPAAKVGAAVKECRPSKGSQPTPTSLKPITILFLHCYDLSLILVAAAPNHFAF